MATTPKSLSIHDLAGAVHKAVGEAKLKLPPQAGPFCYINPGIIIGLIYLEQLSAVPGAQQLAASIAKQVSDHTGVHVAPVVQEGTAGAQAAGGAATTLPPRHVILGYKAGPEVNVNF
jgi:hypothetical protein